MAWQILELQKRFVNRNYIINEIIANMVTHYCFYQENLNRYPMNAEICLNWCRGFYHNVYEPNEKYISEELFNRVGSGVLTDHNITKGGFIPTMSVGEFMELMKAPVEHLENEETCGATPAGFIPPITSPDWPVEVTDYLNNVDKPLDVDSDTNHSRYGGMKKAIGIDLNDDDYDMEYSGSNEDNKRVGIRTNEEAEEIAKNGEKNPFGDKPLKPLNEKEKSQNSSIDLRTVVLKDATKDVINDINNESEFVDLTTASSKDIDVKKHEYRNDNGTINKDAIKKIIEEAGSPFGVNLKEDPRWFWSTEDGLRLLYLTDFKEDDINIPVVFATDMNHIDYYKNHIIAYDAYIVECESGAKYIKYKDNNIHIEAMNKAEDNIKPFANSFPEDDINTEATGTPYVIKPSSVCCDESEGVSNENPFQEETSYFGTSYNGGSDAPRAHYDEATQVTTPSTYTLDGGCNGKTVSGDGSPVISTPITPVSEDELNGRNITTIANAKNTIINRGSKSKKAEEIISTPRSSSKSKDNKKTSKKNNTSNKKSDLPKFNAKFIP